MSEYEVERTLVTLDDRGLTPLKTGYGEEGLFGDKSPGLEGSRKGRFLRDHAGFEAMILVVVRALVWWYKSGLLACYHISMGRVMHRVSTTVRNQ